MRKLTLQEVEEINLISDINSRKDKIQNIVIKEWFKNPRGIFQGFTSVGKSYTICKVIKILNQQQPDSKICIIVPTNHLKDSLIEDIQHFELRNVEVHVVNSFSMSLVKQNLEKEYDLLICDELHTLSNEQSKYFSEVIPRVKYKYFFGVSATLEKEHLEYLKKYNLEVFFDIPLEDGYRTNVVPEYVIYNIPVSLTEEEKRRYVKIQQEYDGIVSMFTKVNLIKPIDAINACLGNSKEKKWYGSEFLLPKEHAEKFGEILNKKAGVVIYLAMKWQKLMSERKLLLNSALNSSDMVLKLAKYINQPTVIVCSSIEAIDKMSELLPNSLPLHSKLSKKLQKENKDKFTRGEAKFLLVAKGLKEGYNNSTLRFLIRQGYTSKALDLTQYLGRLLRPDKDNPDKFSVLINIYIDDFWFKGELIESQQKKWLRSALYNRSFVEWVVDINEIQK